MKFYSVKIYSRKRIRLYLDTCLIEHIYFISKLIKMQHIAFYFGAVLYSNPLYRFFESITTMLYYIFAILFEFNIISVLYEI